MTLIQSILYGSFLAFYLIVCALLILLVLVQKGKSSMGLGNLGGSSQMLFGGSGGQDFLQKTTWVLGFIFIFGSLGLALVQSNQNKESRYISTVSSDVIQEPSNNQQQIPTPSDTNTP